MNFLQLIRKIEILNFIDRIRALILILILFYIDLNLNIDDNNNNNNNDNNDDKRVSKILNYFINKAKKNTYKRVINSKFTTIVKRYC